MALRAHVPDGSLGMFVIGGLAALQSITPDFFTQSFGNFDTNLKEIRFAGFQDHWTASSSLTLDGGFRYDHNRLPSSFPPGCGQFQPSVRHSLDALQQDHRSQRIRNLLRSFELATINRISEFDAAHASLQVLQDTDAAGLYRSGRIPSGPLAGIGRAFGKYSPVFATPTAKSHL